MNGIKPAAAMSANGLEQAVRPKNHLEKTLNSLAAQIHQQKEGAPTPREVPRDKKNIDRINTNLGEISAAKNALATKQSNKSAAASVYVEVKDAMEASHHTSMQIKQQAAASLLAKSNISYTNVLGLLAGAEKDML